MLGGGGGFKEIRSIFELLIFFSLGALTLRVLGLYSRLKFGTKWESLVSSWKYEVP